MAIKKITLKMSDPSVTQQKALRLNKTQGFLLKTEPRE